MRVVGVSLGVGTLGEPVLDGILFSAIIFIGGFFWHRAHQPDTHHILVRQEPQILQRADTPTLTEGLLAALHRLGVVEVPIAFEGVHLGFALSLQFLKQGSFFGLLFLHPQSVNLRQYHSHTFTLRHSGHSHQRVRTFIHSCKRRKFSEHTVTTTNIFIMRIVGT